MNARSVRTTPYPDQAPGTAGLRKRVRVFSQEHYLENFIQSVFDCVPELHGGRVVIGGDGRHWNRHAIQVLLCMAAANGVRTAVVGRGGILSTPAASVVIRASGADGGFILTASHNPAGPDGDFGIKFNIGNGAQAPEALTDRIARRSREIDAYRIVEGMPEVDIDRPGSVWFGDMCIEVIDPVAAHADLLEGLFDFDLIRSRVRDGLTLRFDAMNAVTGPYAAEVFMHRLGFPRISLLRATPLEDFAGLHPDPNPHTAPELVELANGEHPPDLIGASDGDGDRNMIVGPGTVVSPCDSLAVLAANAHRVPGYRDGIAGVARSMPTSRAADRVAAALGVPCHETPTGWRFFSNLLDSGRVTLCGEESFGTSSNHCREKDGLWAVLFWLNLVAVTRKSVPEILHAHWQEYGRTFFVRNDYRIDDGDAGRALYEGLRGTLDALEGRDAAGRRIVGADEFAYDDPVDGSHSSRQGIRVFLEGDARIVYRLSGTGTTGTTLRIYVEDHTTDAARFRESAPSALGDLTEAARDIARVTQSTGLTGPSLVI